MLLYSTESSPLDRSKRFTLHFLADLFIQTPIQLIWEACSHKAITAQRLFINISTSVYSQVMIYTAGWIGASWREWKFSSSVTAANVFNIYTTHKPAITELYDGVWIIGASTMELAILCHKYFRPSDITNYMSQAVTLWYKCLASTGDETLLQRDSGLDIKPFGPLAQGASRFEKLLARGPVYLRSYWPESQYIWEVTGPLTCATDNKTEVMGNHVTVFMVYYNISLLLYINTHFSLTFPKTWMNKIFVIYPLFFIVYFTLKHSENNIIIQPTMHNHEHWKRGTALSIP